MLRSPLTATTGPVTFNSMLSSSEMIAALRGGDAGVRSALDIFEETQQVYAASLAAMGIQTSPTSQVASAAQVTIAVPSCSMSVSARRHEHPTIHTTK